jgi:hypothetical protein
VKILDAALDQRANDRGLLQALAEYLRKLDQTERANDVEAKLVSLTRE